MATAHTQPPTAKRRPAWGSLAVAVLVLGLLAMCSLAPDLPRRLIGAVVPRPDGPGEAPIAAGPITGGLVAARMVDPGLAALGTVATATAPAPDAPPPAAPVVKGPAYAAETRAGDLLAEAERHYAAMAWDQAASVASRTTVGGYDLATVPSGGQFAGLQQKLRPGRFADGLIALCKGFIKQQAIRCQAARSGPRPAAGLGRQPAPRAAEGRVPVPGRPPVLQGRVRPRRRRGHPGRPGRPAPRPGGAA